MPSKNTIFYAPLSKIKVSHSVVSRLLQFKFWEYVLVRQRCRWEQIIVVSWQGIVSFNWRSKVWYHLRISCVVLHTCFIRHQKVGKSILRFKNRTYPTWMTYSDRVLGKKKKVLLQWMGEYGPVHYCWC